MNIRMKRLARAGMIVLCLSGVALAAHAQGTGAAGNLSPAKGANDIGLIFNAGNILLGPESYQAGLGLKVGWGNIALRGLLDLAVNGSSASFSVNGGAVVEYHLSPPPISPYVGGYAKVGYMQPDAFTSIVPLSTGAIAGVEVFISDFLSVFVEYNLAADFTLTTNLQTAQATFDYLIDTRLGNDSKLGIVLYFMRAGAKK
jgi:hypothetical protein